MRTIFIYIFVFVFHYTSIAQHPVYFQFKEENLPDIEFYDMVIDDDEYIWLAANNGLFKFDGVSFQNYTNPKKKGMSVFNLEKDSKNRIWCNNISGQFFYIENDSLHLFKDISPDHNIVPHKYCFNNTNDLFTASKSGLLKIDYQSKDTTILSSYKNVEKNPVFYENSIFFPSYKEVIKLSNGHSKIVYKGGTINLFTDGNNLYLLKVKRSKKGTKTLSIGLWKKDLEKFQDIELPDILKNSRIVSFFRDNNKNLWVNTNKGAFMLSIEGEKYSVKKRLFPNSFISKITQDKEGNYWFSSVDDGLFLIQNMEMKYYSHENKITGSSAIIALEKGVKDSIFYLTKSGEIGVFNNNTLTKITEFSSETVQKIVYDSIRKGIWALGDNLSFIKGKEIFAMRRLGLDIFYKDISLNSKNELIYASQIRAGILSNPLKNLTNKTIRNNRSYKTHYDSHTKGFYINYIDKLSYYKDQVKNSITYKNETFFATDLCTTTDSIVWVATYNYGILGIKDGKVITKHDKKDGLLSNQINKITADGKDVWVAYEKQLQKIDRSNNTLLTIDENDGLQGSKIFDILINNSTLYVASTKGIIALNKEEKFFNKIPPNISITSFKVNEEHCSLQNLNTLSYKQNNIQIDFQTIGLNQNKNSKKYKYRLKGIDKDWITTATKFARYPALSNGNYNFEVKGVNEDGIESKNTATIRFSIDPPFWKTYWFITLVILLAVSITYLFIKGRLKREQLKNERIQKQKELERDLIYSKLTALRSQMNPHFTFNALNSIQEYIITNEKEQASDYLGKFAKLIRTYLDQSNDTDLTLDEEIKTLSQYLELEKMRFTDSFEYHIHIDKTIDRFIKIPTLLIQPYVENAIKHGLLHKDGLKILSIEFSLNSSKSDILICKVKDNGIGRKEAEKLKSQILKTHKSFSSKASRNRLELISASIENRNIGIQIVDRIVTKMNRTQGTEVIISIPIISNE